MTTLHPRQQQVYDLVAAAPDGIAAKAIAKVLGTQQDAAMSHLRALRELGLLACTHPVGGQGALWALPDRCIVLRKLAAEATRRLKRDRDRVRKIEGPASLDAWLYPKHRWLSVGSYVVHAPARPMSIFHQGGWS